MRIGKINDFFIGGLMALASLTLSSCDVSPYRRIVNYMGEHSHTQKEYEDILSQAETTSFNRNCVIQSRLDSMAYRDLLNTTSRANDSAIVAEFNQLAATINYANNTKKGRTAEEYISNVMKEAGCTVVEYENAKSDNGSVLQHNVDRYIFEKFFKQHGFMNDKFKHKFDSISSVIIGHN